MKKHLAPVLTGFCLDLLLADPESIPHPVVFMGKTISVLEEGLRAWFPAVPAGELCAGTVLAAALPAGTLLLTGKACRAAKRIHPAAGFALETLWCWQSLALTGLASEARNVYEKLADQNLPAARNAVGRIVGRDTKCLSVEGVTKAAVETVAENFSDGVAAPLFYMFLGGAPLAMTYKAINTMDSMVGYKNGRYLYFGRAAARLDDAANYLPSRLAALLWIGGAALSGQDAGNAFRIWRRDRRNHPSPNSAQTEAACAGALHIQLAGPAFYFGQLHKKPVIGDADRPVTPFDILSAIRTLYASSALALAAGTAVTLGRKRKKIPVSPS